MGPRFILHMYRSGGAGGLHICEVWVVSDEDTIQGSSKARERQPASWSIPSDPPIIPLQPSLLIPTIPSYTGPKQLSLHFITTTCSSLFSVRIGGCYYTLSSLSSQTAEFSIFLSQTDLDLTVWTTAQSLPSEANLNCFLRGQEDSFFKYLCKPSNRPRS